ncbi:hypothetical protein DEU56DRAFT_909234 [Suillus clintonianus]|uniref:uncharacterized protein n=1 Tax=Suillus clintonianus TaxID=1904413 RepID=UPI001B8770B1|nr:uncharacterized protein DEU56DRAFT_909234 [Suillus clintonianus]KAG2148936.1 hypothetical protein DEU56DRAFT_909234 [Suillus clintonianus]
MSDQLTTISACLVSFSPDNGFVDLDIEPGLLKLQDLRTKGSKYFCSEAEIKQCRITFRGDKETNDAEFQLIVLYDHKLHGTDRCPYLAFKTIDKVMTSVEKEDYMAVIKSVDLMKHKLRPFEQVHEGSST